MGSCVAEDLHLIVIYRMTTEEHEHDADMLADLINFIGIHYVLLV